MFNLKVLKRLMLSFALLFLSVAAIVSLCFGDFTGNILPFACYVVPATHVTSCLLTLYSFIFINSKASNYTQIIVLFLESTVTLLTGFEFLGLLLYSSILILGYCYGFLKKHNALKVHILVLYWFGILFGIFPSDKIMFAIVFVASLYVIFFYLFVLYSLEVKFSTYIPAEAKHNSFLPQAGEILDLSKLEISDRDRQIIMCLCEGKNYQEISEKIFYSVSTVKKDVLALCDFFKVKNVAELKMLLFQYRVLCKSAETE